jgi:hypothetical protein
MPIQQTLKNVIAARSYTSHSVDRNEAQINDELIDLLTPPGIESAGVRRLPPSYPMVETPVSEVTMRRSNPEPPEVSPTIYRSALSFQALQQLSSAQLSVRREILHAGGCAVTGEVIKREEGCWTLRRTKNSEDRSVGDVIVPAGFIRRHSLNAGDCLTGLCRLPKAETNEVLLVLKTVDEIIRFDAKAGASVSMQENISSEQPHSPLLTMGKFSNSSKHAQNKAERIPREDAGHTTVHMYPSKPSAERQRVRLSFGKP